MSYYTERNEYWLSDEDEMLLYSALKYFKESNNIDTLCNKANVSKEVFESLFDTFYNTISYYENVD